MKTIYLIFHNIKKLMQQHRLTVGIVVCSLAVSTFGILFYAGYTYIIASERRSEAGDVLRLAVRETAHSEEILQLITHCKEPAKMQSILAAAGKPTHALSAENYPVVGEYDANYDQRIQVGSNFEVSETRPLILLPEEYVGRAVGMNASPVGKQIHIGFAEYTVWGVASYLNYNYIVVPVEYYIRHLPVRYLEIKYQNQLGQAEKDRISKAMNQHKAIEYYEFYTPGSIAETPVFWIELAPIFLVFAAIILNVFTLIYFLMKQSKTIYNIYSICGGSRKKVMQIIISQCFILILAGILSGSVLFTIFSGFLEGINLIAGNAVWFYGMTLLLEIFITFLFTIGTALKANRNNELYIVKE